MSSTSSGKAWVGLDKGDVALFFTLESDSVEG